MEVGHLDRMYQPKHFCQSLSQSVSQWYCVALSYICLYIKIQLNIFLLVPGIKVVRLGAKF